MITITVEQMLGSVQALNELVEAEINIVSAFKIARLTADINKEIETFIDVKNAMIAKFDLEDEDDQAKAQTQMKVLLDEEISLNHNQIAAQGLGEKAIVKPKVLMALDWLFQDGDPE
jgi:hypothetical protein